MPSSPGAPDPAAKELDRLLTELSRLEDLLEEMLSLGVSSATEVAARLALLNARLDDLPDD